MILSFCTIYLLTLFSCGNPAQETEAEDSSGYGVMEFLGDEPDEATEVTKVDKNTLDQSNPWPVPKFHFKVTFGEIGVIDFQEVSGLDSEYDMIEYRAGTWQPWSTVKQPGLMKSSDVTFKKGMLKTNTTLTDYFFESVSMNVVERQDVTIELLDEEGNILFIWTLSKAFPLKITFPDFNAEGSELAIEEITLAHQGMSMAVGQ